jgi:hypothetical protein
MACYMVVRFVLLLDSMGLRSMLSDMVYVM